jgi:hypothetical protein
MTAALAPRGQVDPSTGEISEAPQRGAAGAGALLQVETQRAVAEIQARTLVARATPRNAVRAMDLILQDCQHLGLAEDAAYQYARSGTDIRGASIRLVEAVARRWGNMASGIKEVFRHDGWSECIAFAWDLESTSYEERQFPVRHWRDTRRGGYAVTEERDIYELVANAGQRRKRSCLEALIPRDVIDAALSQCETTLKAKADTSPAAMQKMIEGFAAFGVTREQIEARIQRRLDAIQPAQVVGLRRVYASLRDGISVVSDWFEPAIAPPPPAIDADGPAATPDDAPKAARKRAPKAQPVPVPPATTENAATAPPQASPASSADAPRPIVAFLDDLEALKPEDREGATLLLDLGRTDLPPDQYVLLLEAWRVKFEEIKP